MGWTDTNMRPRDSNNNSDDDDDDNTNKLTHVHKEMTQHHEQLVNYYFIYSNIYAFK